MMLTYTYMSYAVYCPYIVYIIYSVYMKLALYYTRLVSKLDNNQNCVIHHSNESPSQRENQASNKGEYPNSIL